jgi:hypothetical protein
MLLKVIGKGFRNNDDFVVGEDDFKELQINPSPNDPKFFYFYHHKDHRLIKWFVLAKKERVDYICRVDLIKKEERFTPRLTFSIRDKANKTVVKLSAEETKIKASVSLAECHENLWKLIGYLQSLKEIDIPKESFSLVSAAEGEIVEAIRALGTTSAVNILKQVLATSGASLTPKDVSALLNRKAKLSEFESGLTERATTEPWWQDFFEVNKWIFGYGLDYRILRQEQAQPSYGGTRLDGGGGERGDYLMSTAGDVSFTVLVEIKTPATSLLQGIAQVRNGAWSLSKALTDALVQLQANLHSWDKVGSRVDANRDLLESEDKYTVHPRGIIVVGSLAEVKDVREKRATFQRFRNSIHGIEIVTFDELLERARFIVDSQ